jgi:hypothetical protein
LSISWRPLAALCLRYSQHYRYLCTPVQLTFGPSETSPLPADNLRDVDQDLAFRNHMLRGRRVDCLRFVLVPRARPSISPGNALRNLHWHEISCVQLSIANPSAACLGPLWNVLDLFKQLWWMQCYGKSYVSHDKAGQCSRH